MQFIREVGSNNWNEFRCSRLYLSAFNNIYIMFEEVAKYTYIEDVK
jgi:hypothetical protein